LARVKQIQEVVGGCQMIGPIRARHVLDAPPQQGNGGGKRLHVELSEKQPVPPLAFSIGLLGRFEAATSIFFRIPLGQRFR